VARLAGCTKTQEEWDKEGKRALLPLQSLRWPYVVNRVRWFRARAEVERWEEEERILRKEFEFTYRSFQFLSSTWSKTASVRTDRYPGYVSYAHERADMYLQMAKDCAAAYEEVTGEALLCAKCESVLCYFIVIHSRKPSLGSEETSVYQPYV
jgi:hypothetical protein